ncbi:hypothetical protein [Ottowia sp. VDI28]|uniref:hypothetical protein n=1 Tax=Ottowia sp. VDI28 TaxID=3133968 RepID=UPI003C2DBE6E
MNHQTVQGATPLHAEAAEHPLLAEWRRFTNEGLAASQAHCVAHAVTWHARALQVAHHLMARPQPGIAEDDLVAAFLVAHVNLADCHAEMGQTVDAADCLYCAHHKLMALLHSETAPEAMQLAAGKQLHMSHAALKQHCARYGEHPLLAKALHECSLHLVMPGSRLH